MAADIGLPSDAGARVVVLVVPGSDRMKIARRREVNIGAPAQRSPAARRKAATKQTDDALPVHSFRTLIADLATLTHNTMVMADHPDANFVLYPQLPPLQARAFDLLGVTVKL